MENETRSVITLKFAALVLAGLAWLMGLGDSE
jgi:hypothetical protein